MFFSVKVARYAQLNRYSQLQLRSNFRRKRMVCACHTNLGLSTLLFMARTNHMLHTECSNGAAIDCIAIFLVMRRYYSCSNLTILLVLSALWLFLGEVGIYYVYSWKWYWPELGISTEDLEKYFTRENLQGVTGDLYLPSERYHYQNGDSHYYSHPVHSKHAQEEREVALKVLLMSDPHIMCTFNK